jgi:hypothetical protein
MERQRIELKTVPLCENVSIPEGTDIEAVIRASVRAIHQLDTNRTRICDPQSAPECSSAAEQCQVKNEALVLP